MGRPHPPMAAHRSMLLPALLLVSRQQRAAMLLLRLLLQGICSVLAPWLGQTAMGALWLQRHSIRRLLRGLVLQRQAARPRCPASRLMPGLQQLGQPWMSCHVQAQLPAAATAVGGLGKLLLAARPTRQLLQLRLSLASLTCCTSTSMLK